MKRNPNEERGGVVLTINGGGSDASVKCGKDPTISSVGNGKNGVG
jgi:hypothetical protein